MPTALLDTGVVSFITVAELFQWAVVRNWGTQRRHQLDQALSTYLIVPPDVEMCRIWGNVRGERQAAGQTISPQDAWIAATAIRHQLPLVTHNVRDYLGITSLDVRTAAHP